MRALGVREPKRIIVVAAHQRSRGCAEVGRRDLSGKQREGRAMVIAVAPPSRFRLRRLARLFEHELGHTSGLEHEQMTKQMFWSLGQTPDWAKGSRIRYRGRAPDQL